jgi:hypothetical protein
MGFSDWNPISPNNIAPVAVKTAAAIKKLSTPSKVASDAHANQWGSGAGYNISGNQATAMSKAAGDAWKGTPAATPALAAPYKLDFTGPAWKTPAQLAAASGVITPAPQGGGSGGGGPAGPSAYELQSQQDRARLAALFDAYSKQIGGMSTDINANYDTSQNTLANLYQNATQQSNAGYDAARTALTAQMQALGLSGVTPATNTDAQLASADRYTNLGALAGSQNVAERQAAVANNQALVNAVAGEKNQGLQGFDRTVSENVLRQAQAQAQAQAAAQAASDRAAAAQAERDWQHQYAYDKPFLAAQAAAQTARTPVDVSGLYQQFVTGGMNSDTALKLATEQARYMG